MPVLGVSSCGDGACRVSVPSNYVVLADMTRVSLVGLERGNDRSLYTLVYDQSFNSFTGVALDTRRQLIYYTDVNRSPLLTHFMTFTRLPLTSPPVSCVTPPPPVLGSNYTVSQKNKALQYCP